MRKPFVAGNWKMNKTSKEAAELITQLKRGLTDFDQADILICPPFTALSEASDLLIDSNIKLGAQNMHWEDSGAFTGEISGSMLKEAGCSYVIIGHSERRTYFGETNETVNRRIRAALRSGLMPVVCVGETLDERDCGKTVSVIEKQLEEGLKGISLKDDIIIAYEPVWAIGTGRNATPEQAQEVHKFIRIWVDQNFSPSFAFNMRIIYGGSVKAENVSELMKESDIDGSLVGGASLNGDSFISIARNSVYV